MILTELVLQNFGPYAGHQIINLRPEKDGFLSPIILFGGMNGDGKTTLMDAIRLALYGQRAQCSTRGNLSYSEFLTQSVNKQTSPPEQTRIELAFEHIVYGQWKQFRIVRSWTKNPKDGRDTLGILEEDWPDLTLANTWDEYIENILPLGISNLFLFDGEQVKELAEQESPPQVVIEAIQSLLGLELAEKLSIDLEILASRKRKAIADLKQLANLEKIELKLQQHTQEAKIHQQTLTKLEDKLKLAQVQYEEASEKFRIEGGKIAAERTQLTEKIARLSSDAENQRNEMRHLAATAITLELIAPFLKQAQLQIQVELDIQQARVAYDVIKKRNKKLLLYLSKLSLNSDQTKKIEQFLEEENKSLNEKIQGDSTFELGLSREHLKKLDDALKHQLPMQVSLAKKYLKKLKEIEDNLDFTERELAVAASPEEYQKLDENLKKAQKKLINCQADYQASQRRYEEAKKAIERTKKELKKYGEQAFEKKNDKYLVQSVTKVQETLQVFRERLTLKKLNKLEVQVTECFRYLLHKTDLVHRVAVNANNFSLSLYDTLGQPVAKHRLSAGEKQLLAIAFLWGLARVSGRNLPIAIDTPLGRLDSSHRNNLVERYFPAASHQVILLSTDTEIGKLEVEKLRKQKAIARQYLLKYDSKKRQTTIAPDCYFE